MARLEDREQEFQSCLQSQAFQVLFQAVLVVGEFQCRAGGQRCLALRIDNEGNLAVTLRMAPTRVSDPRRDRLLRQAEPDITAAAIAERVPREVGESITSPKTTS